MRVLHLIDGSSPQATATTLALMAQSLGRLGHIHQHTLLLGGGSLTQAAQDSGIHEATTLGVPFERAWLGWPAVRRRIWQLGHFDLLHCWSIGSLSLATLLSRTQPRLLTLTQKPPPAAVRWLRVVTGESQSPTTVLTASSTIRQALLAGGMPLDSVHVLRPGIDMGRIDQARRDTVRKAWGAQDKQSRVLALLHDTPQSANCLTMGLALSMAQDSAATAGLHMKLLVHPDQSNRSRLEKMMRQLGRTSAVIQEARLAQPWTVLPGCDAALSIGPEGAGMSLLWAMAANVPIVGEACYANSEVIEDRHSALLTQPDSPHSIARQVTRLLTDSQLAWKLRDTARHEAYSFFSRQRYCQSLREVYTQVIEGQTVKVPEMESTGGLRFAGQG